MMELVLDVDLIDYLVREKRYQPGDRIGSVELEWCSGDVLFEDVTPFGARA